MRRAGEAILAMGAGAVLVKGGHLAGGCAGRSAGDAGGGGAVRGSADCDAAHAWHGVHLGLRRGVRAGAGDGAGGGGGPGPALCAGGDTGRARAWGRAWALGAWRDGGPFPAGVSWARERAGHAPPPGRTRFWKGAAHDSPSRTCVRTIPNFPPVPAPSARAGRWRRWRARCSAAAIAPSGPKARLAEVIERSRAVLGMPADWRLGIVPASDTGAVEMALWSLLGRARRGRAGVGELFRGLGDRHRQAAEAGRRARVWRRPMASCRTSAAVDWRAGRGVRLERHDLRRAACRTADWIRRGPRGARDLRRDLGGVRHGPALGQARCGHLVLAEGAGRRGGARHAGAVAARGGAAGELQAGLAAAEDLPPDQGRQADRGHLQGRDDQHALDALRRGRAGRAALGRERRRAGGAGRALRGATWRRSRPGSRAATGRASWPRIRRRAPAPRSA